MTRIARATLGLVALLAGPVMAEESGYSKHARACQAKFPSIATFTPDQFGAAKSEIEKILPILSYGSERETEDALYELGTKIATSPFRKGTEFFKSAAGYAGVRITFVENKKTKAVHIRVQSLDSMGVNPVGPGERAFGYGNGPVVEHEGELLLISNKHVIFPMVGRDYEPPKPGSKEYELDAAAVELKREEVPSSIQPSPLRSRPEAELTGRPFLIATIHWKTRATGLEALSIIPGFVIPTPRNVIEPKDSAKEVNRMIFAHSGLLHDCAPFINPLLGTRSGSPVFDAVTHEHIGLFFGHAAWKRKRGGFVKMTRFIPNERIVGGLKSGAVPKFRVKLEWIRGGE